MARSPVRLCARWETLLVNFLFWSGIAQAGVVLSALLQVTSARWGRPLKRVAEATAAFMPVSFLVLLVLFLGQAVILPWVQEPVEAKQAWLNTPFFVARQGAGFLLLSGLSLLYVYWSVRPDIGLLQESGTGDLGFLAQRLVRGWRGLNTERDVSQQRQSRLAPAILIVYAYVFSLQAFDFVMSLDPHWFSTLLGGYFFIGNLYHRRGVPCGRGGLDTHPGEMARACWHGPASRRREALARLLHAVDLPVLTQYLVIWYGDLPEETAFVMHRTAEAPWRCWPGSCCSDVF